MKLYHVSCRNADKEILDMSIKPKNDFPFVNPLIIALPSFTNFRIMLNSELVLNLSITKDWPLYKIATEAIFEWVRMTKYPEKPSRLRFTYFNDSLESARLFNQDERDNKGAIFEFDGDSSKCYCFDMNIFTDAARELEAEFKEHTLNFTLYLADNYWRNPSKVKSEILYMGYPVLKRIK